MQQLTTEQVEILGVLKLLEEYEDENHIGCTLNEKIKDFCWESLDEEISQESADEYIAMLRHYGYLDNSNALTMEGKQYWLLAREYINIKRKQPTLVINNSFTLLNVEKLGVNMDILSGFGKAVLEISQKVKIAIKK